MVDRYIWNISKLSYLFQSGYKPFIYFLGFITFSCYQQEPQGIAPTLLPPDGQIGPQVIFDPLMLPDPEIPFPNDIACIFDPRSPTGCRVNLSALSSTKTETAIKTYLDDLSGFSTYAPITVSFNGRLDLSTITRQSVIIIKIPKHSSLFESPVPLDLGEGSYPSEIKPIALFPGDPHANEKTVIFPNTNEVDISGNKVFISHYEVATNTLIIRPLFPLDEASQYAVILTKFIKGFSPDGTYGPIVSPFPFVNHPSQTNDLLRVIPSLKQIGINPEDIAFAWTFTTQDNTGMIRALRDGLYGKGQFAWIAKELPPYFAGFDDTGITFDSGGKGLPFADKDNIAIIQASYMQKLFETISGVLPQKTTFDFSSVDYFAFGWIYSLDFRATKERIFDIDPVIGRATYKPSLVPILISVPKATTERKPPFPVVVYAHGNSTSRFEMILFSNTLAKAGFAGIALDAVGHGPLAPDLKSILTEAGVTEDIARLILLFLCDLLLENGTKGLEDKGFDEILMKLQTVGLFNEITSIGRASDENHDGKIENGEGFFLPNPFQQRDVFRQLQFDYLALIRVIRNLSQDNVPKPADNLSKNDISILKPSLIAGDLNTDGILDFGGQDAPIYMAGTSLGGIMTILVTGVEPEIKAAVPLVAGAGLTDIFTRSTLRGRFDQSFYLASGPLLVACPIKDRIFLSWNADSNNGIPKHTTHWDCDENKDTWYMDIPLPPPPFQVEAENLANGEKRKVTSDEHGYFYVSMPSDKGDKWLLRINGTELIVIVPQEGLAIERNTPKMRKNIQIMQTILDPADPANFAPYIMVNPVGRPRNLLQIAVIADSTVPIASQIALARIVGNFGLNKEISLSVNKKFIDTGVIAGKDFDVDDLDCNNNGFGPLPPVPAGDGFSAVRFANVHGFHEYMAVLDPSLPFDAGQYTHNQVMLYLMSGAKRIEDSPCIEDNSCPCLNIYKTCEEEK